MFPCVDMALFFSKYAYCALDSCISFVEERYVVFHIKRVIYDVSIERCPHLFEGGPGKIVAALDTVPCGKVIELTEYVVPV